MNGACNMRSDRYFVALKVGTCNSCGAMTRLVALVLPPSHQVLALDEVDDRARADFVDSWETAACSAFLFFVEHLPDSVRRGIQAIAPAYRCDGGIEPQGVYWANHCERCGSRFDDQELFCEPGGAFLPVAPQDAAEIELLLMEEPIEVAAAGYAYEPAFFSSMRRT